MEENKEKFMCQQDVIDDRRARQVQKDLDYLIKQIGTIDRNELEEIQIVYQWSHLFNELDLIMGQDLH